MAKSTKSTNVKLSVTHDRLSLIVKYTNGETFKMSRSRSGEKCSCNIPVGLERANSYEPMFKFVNKFKTENETLGEKFERLSNFFKDTTSLNDALCKLK